MSVVLKRRIENVCVPLRRAKHAMPATIANETMRDRDVGTIQVKLRACGRVHSAIIENGIIEHRLVRLRRRAIYLNALP